MLTSFVRGMLLSVTPLWKKPAARTGIRILDDITLMQELRRDQREETTQVTGN
jgi:hypothetical protein